MEKLYTQQELMDRWHCKPRTARDRMREIGVVSRNPALCLESMVEAWERAQAEKARQPKENPQTMPAGRRNSRKGKQALPFPAIEQGPLKPGQLISRVRPKIIREA